MSTKSYYTRRIVI